jgi:ACS family tartrate transporter-like MFS transporter
VYVIGYAVSYCAAMGIQAVFFLIPADFLRGPSAAAGLAAVGSIGMVGAFVGPAAWGVARDFTGGYRAGPCCCAAIFWPGDPPPRRST